MALSVQARQLAVARFVAVTVVTIAALRIAWMSDDALITLRHALNITHGWGPGFNATESVQGYTHPLWFLLWLGVGQTNQWVIGLLLVSVALSAFAVFLAVRAAGSLARIALIGGLLLLSNAFMEFTTSGLENPLAYALVGVLITLSLSPQRTWWWGMLLGLTTAAVLLTRFDLALLILPALILMLWRFRSSLRIIGVGVLAALVPLILWFAWSKLTYDTWLPNTFAAKQNVDIPRLELLVQGLRYLWVTFEHDPVSLIVLLIGLACALLLGPRLARIWAVGALLYVAYVIWIGGDFMAGRFLSVPVYVAAFLLAFVHSPLTARHSRGEPAKALMAVAGFLALLLLTTTQTQTLATTLANPQAPRWEVDQNFNAGVSDELGVYVANGRNLKSYIDNLSLAYLNPDTVPIGDGSGLNRTLRELHKAAANWPTRTGEEQLPSEVGEFCGFIGTVGIAVGPAPHLIDNCALTDRFLAERPFVPAEPFAWKPGHFHRGLPEGYREAILFNDPQRMADAADAFYLAQLWNRIRPSRRE